MFKYLAVLDEVEFFMAVPKLHWRVQYASHIYICLRLGLSTQMYLTSSPL